MRKELPPLRLDVFIDLICPWCFIGKRRLERAIALREMPAFEVRWRSFQLNPGMPPGGMERSAYLAAKFGSAAQASRIYDAVLAAGRIEKIAFNFSAIHRTPNTLNAHRLLRWVRDLGLANELVEALFRAYFLEGKDLGDTDVLSAIAQDLGIHAAKTGSFLAGTEGSAAVQAEDTLARRTGINGVPCFVFNGRFALAGAHEPEVLFHLFEVAEEEARHGAAGDLAAVPALR